MEHRLILLCLREYRVDPLVVLLWLLLLISLTLHWVSFLISSLLPLSTFDVQIATSLPLIDNIYEVNQSYVFFFFFLVMCFLVFFHWLWKVPCGNQVTVKKLSPVRINFSISTCDVGKKIIMLSSILTFTLTDFS